MELTAGYPFWLIEQGLKFKYPKLNKDVKTDALVIGGGISGALSAYYLTEAGIQTILVDARSIGLGSTCASTSLLQYELDIPLHLLKDKVGKETATRSYQLCAEAIGKLTDIMRETGYSEYETCNSLFFSRHAREKLFMEREFNARKEAGFNMEFLGEDQLHQLYGLKACFGIRSEIGATMNTYSLTHHLLQYCIKKGLQVYDRTKITELEEQSNSLGVATENKHKIKASYVINATGYEVINFLDKKIVNFDCTYAIASEHQEENAPFWKDRAMMWNTDSPYLYLRLTKDNRILAGGRDEPFSNKTTRQLFLEKKARLIEKDIKKILPRLNFRTEFSWSGTFGKTKDSLPYIGRNADSQRIFYALGFGGNGITFSQVAAEINRDLILGKKNKNVDYFSFTR